VNQATTDKQTDFLRYWLLVRSRLWLVISLAIVVTVLVGMVVKDMPTMYKATVTMLLAPEQAKVISMQDMFAGNAGGRIYFNTQVGIIQSRSILDKLINELDLEHSPEFSSSQPSKLSWIKSILKMNAKSVSEEEQKRQVLEAVRKKITVENPPYTKFIKLSFESESAVMAAKEANTLADIYITDSLDSRVQMAHQATDWMRQRADELRQKLSQAEGRLQSFIDQKGLVNTGEGVTALTSQELTALTVSSLQARASVSELSQRYGAKHPKLIAARAELARAQAALNRSKSKIRRLGKQDVQLKALQHEVDSTRKLYETILNRLKETDQASTLITASARVVDPAEAPLKHEKSKKKLIVIGAFVLTLAAGIGLILLLDLLDSTIHSIKDVEDRLGMPMLGLLPLLKFNSKKQSMADKLDEMISGSHHQFNEAIRTIRTGIMLSAIDNPHKVILVISSLPGEGKSTVAANLAIAMGKLERVLLLDADLRRPTVAKHFGMNTKVKGLSELVSGTASFKDCLERNETYHIDVMHAGIIPPNPLELLASNRFQAVLKSFENHYDRIIIDSTPVQAVSDALVLSQYARGVVYVVKADATPDRMIKNCFKRLREVNAPVIGVVLNQVDIKKSARYGYEDYEGYYDHYGYSDQENKA